MPRLCYNVFPTDWGWVAVAASERGVRLVTLPEPTRRQAAERLAVLLKGQPVEFRPALFEHFEEQLRRSLRGKLVLWDVALDLDGAPAFFRRAWAACQAIPAGQTRTYTWLAAEAGSPRAARAAGQAMARNPVPLVVPCHRVIASDGSLGGFGGPGPTLKARLLELERRNNPALS